MGASDQVPQQDGPSMMGSRSCPADTLQCLSAVAVVVVAGRRPPWWWPCARVTQTSQRRLSCPPLPRTIDSMCPWLVRARTAPAQHQAPTCNPARQQVLSAVVRSVLRPTPSARRKDASARRCASALSQCRPGRAASGCRSVHAHLHGVRYVPQPGQIADTSNSINSFLELRLRIARI